MAGRTQAKPEQRGRQEAESWPCLLGSQHCNRVKNHVVAKPETVGEAQIVGKSHTAVLYILNTKCLINLSVMPEPNLFKLSSALKGNTSFTLVCVFSKELTQHFYCHLWAGRLKSCCYCMSMSFQHLSKESTKTLLEHGIPSTHIHFLPPTPTPEDPRFQAPPGCIVTNCIYHFENSFLILATLAEQYCFTSSICPNIMQTFSFKPRMRSWLWFCILPDSGTKGGYFRLFCVYSSHPGCRIG